MPRTPLVGRQAERVATQDLLLDEAVPLLTLTGPGGVGKTRLALATAGDVASQFADGVAWVDLAPLADASLVPATVARAVGIVPAPGASVKGELIRHLRPRQHLLLLDNCEHLLTVIADLAANLLSACPALQVLATSRAPLHIRGEQELPVDPLSLPKTTAPLSLDRLGEIESVRLFVERARAIRPAFALAADNAGAIAELCCRLDGLPLAIELAAARIKVMSPEALLAQMSDRLRLLTGGPRDAPARQQTIRDAIAWSYELLLPPEKRLFRYLAVFAGGFTLEAAQAMHGSHGDGEHLVVDRLAALVDQSLARRTERAGEPRFAMLETIRKFGLESLIERGEEGDARERHAAYFVAVAERAELHLHGVSGGRRPGLPT